jgi:proteasome accessory factor B
MKLRAAGTDIDDSDAPGAVPDLDTSDPSLPAMLEAARTARAVRFDYLKSGAGTAQTRTLEPWGVLSWRGRWYVAGLDRDRDEPRSFRLSRIIGAVDGIGQSGAFERPDDIDLLGMVSGRVADDTIVGHVLVTGPGVVSLRRIADRDDGGVLEITYSDTNWLARQIAAAGSAAQALDPPELVQAVLARLRAVAGSPA